LWGIEPVINALLVCSTTFLSFFENSAIFYLTPLSLSPFYGEGVGGEVIIALNQSDHINKLGEKWK
jgi:hypothetical protein